MTGNSSEPIRSTDGAGVASSSMGMRIPMARASGYRSRIDFTWARTCANDGTPVMRRPPLAPQFAVYSSAAST